MLQLDAERYFEVDAAMIPARLASVTGSAFDFTRARRSARAWTGRIAQLRRARVRSLLRAARGRGQAGRHARVRKVARVYDPGSGRELTASTDQRGLQFYTGNHSGKPGHPPHGGFCLEAGAFPNHVNMDDAASVVIRPGQVYRQETRYRLGVLE